MAETVTSMLESRRANGGSWAVTVTEAMFLLVKSSGFRTMSMPPVRR